MKNQSNVLKVKKETLTKQKNNLSVYWCIHRSITYEEYIMGKKEEKYRNVGILIDDHELLRKLAFERDRSMVKQLSHLTKKSFVELQNHKS